MKPSFSFFSYFSFFFFLFSFLSIPASAISPDNRVNDLISRMTLDEKIGQMSQFNGFNGTIPEDFKEKLRQGMVGSVLNEVNTETLNAMQRIAVEESRLGIPLIFARDVIHGFKTILPIPLGQAASWNPELVEEGARMAALEAASTGIRWTFAPMIDVTRDPRWGRIAEGLGEDPYLLSVLGAAMVCGFQGKNLADRGSIAACPKHFAGYGAAEGGRDYNTASIPENELRDVFLPPFKAGIDAGAATIMAAFNELNGVPATGNEFLLRQVLRDEWKFDGFVVSDWESVPQLVVHGFKKDNKEAAAQSVRAGVDMEMASTTYARYIKELLAENTIGMQHVDEAVSRILTLKFKLGLFDAPYTDPAVYPEPVSDRNRETARKMAVQSLVLLQNRDSVLPLSAMVSSVAVIGPMADQPHEQLGTWIFDGDRSHSVTPLQAIKNDYPHLQVAYASGLEFSRSRDRTGFKEAAECARESDVVLLFLGEESILSGESHCRADIGLPGAQEALVDEIAQTGKPVVAVIMAGRPLTIRSILGKVHAVLYAWHPGTMAGPAICDVLFGKTAPSGKLPVTFPTTVGQIPIYYAHKNTGKPASDKTWEKLDDIPVGAFQLSIGNTSHYLDEGFAPLFPFGFGLSYTRFDYSDITASSETYTMTDTIRISAVVQNTGACDGDEVVQLYVRDLVADRTRPVRELKGFRRISLKKGESRRVLFTLTAEDLSFHNREMERVTEPGVFRVWIGGDSNAERMTEFELIN